MHNFKYYIFKVHNNCIFNTDVTDNEIIVGDDDHFIECKFDRSKFMSYFHKSYYNYEQPKKDEFVRYILIQHYKNNDLYNLDLEYYVRYGHSQSNKDSIFYNPNNLFDIFLRKNKKSMFEVLGDEDKYDQDWY